MITDLVLNKAPLVVARDHSLSKSPSSEKRRQKKPERRLLLKTVFMTFFLSNESKKKKKTSRNARKHQFQTFLLVFVCFKIRRDNQAIELQFSKTVLAS